MPQERWKEVLIGNEEGMGYLDSVGKVHDCEMSHK